VQGMVRVLQDRYGLSKRENPQKTGHESPPRTGASAEPSAEPEQAAFAW